MNAVWTRPEMNDRNLGDHLTTTTTATATSTTISRTTTTTTTVTATIEGN